MLRIHAFSYGGGKIACELIGISMLVDSADLETVIFRPHNFIGPDMGFEHVIPEITGKIVKASDGLTKKEIDLVIQGDGSETRSFCDVTDGGRGCFLAGEFGENGNIYHVGTEEEVSIKQLVETIGKYCGVKVNVVPGELTSGWHSKALSSNRQSCENLATSQSTTLNNSLRRCVSWYVDYYTAKS